jgi:hypothetical protein
VVFAYFLLRWRVAFPTCGFRFWTFQKWTDPNRQHRSDPHIDQKSKSFPACGIIHDCVQTRRRRAITLDHGFPQLMRERERRLALHAKIAAEGKHAFAILLGAERCNRHQVVLERELVRSKQGARRYREVGATRLAAPPRLIRRARATCSRLSLRSADTLACHPSGASAGGRIAFCPAIRHLHHLARIERTRAADRRKCWAAEAVR